MKTIYKVDSFGCTFSSRGKFTAQLQAMLDYYAEEGWKLQSCHLLSELCVVIFYREVEE